VKLGGRKEIVIEIVRNKRGYFINYGRDNHRSIGPLDEEPTFQEALAIYESIAALDKSIGGGNGS
jgi:hypothetical protein